MQPRPAAKKPRHWADGSSRKKNGNAARLKGLCYYCGITIDSLPPTVATRGIQNLPLWVALPSLLQENRRRPLRRLSRGPDRVGKLTRGPSPWVCNLDRVVTQHTSTAVDSIPDPSVRFSSGLVPLSPRIQRFRFSSTLLSLVSLTLYPHLLIRGPPRISLDSSLATSPPFVLEPLDRPITLCLFDGNLRRPGLSMSL